MVGKERYKTLKIILLHSILSGWIFLTLIPILYALSISFSATNTLLSENFRFFPQGATLANYRALITEQPLTIWFVNTSLLALFTLALALSVAIPAAYVFSRRRFKGRMKLFKTLILLNAFPAILSMFALWRLMNVGPLPLVNTRLGLILIYAGTMTIFGILNLKGYFDTVPLEIEDASRMDGASEWQVIWYILLPLAKPAIVVTSVLILIFVWNEYIFAVTFMTGAENYTLAAGLFSLQAGEISGSWPIFAAGAMVTSLPILIIFFIIQRNMLSGLTIGGVKG